MPKKTMNDVWKHLYPDKERKVSQNSLNNLVTEKPKWKNLPTKAIRVPEIFANKLVETARIWDRGNSIKRNTNYSNKNMEQAISILEQSLKMKPNNGSAIKREIREALKLLKQDSES